MTFSYQHTHISVFDGSPAMKVSEHDGDITLVNEDGYEWTDPAYDWEEIKVWTREDCDAEFGEDHTHDDAECARILDTMTGGYDYTEYDYPSYDSQYDHYERFGRPAFPNEY